MPIFAHVETGKALDPSNAADAQTYRSFFAPSLTVAWNIQEVRPKPPAVTVEHGATPDGGFWVNPTPAPGPAPRPQPISLLAFLRLCQGAGGMTDQMLIDCDADPLFKAFWIKFKLADHIECNDPDTQAGLTALAQAGYLPRGKDAVVNAWPK